MRVAKTFISTLLIVFVSILFINNVFATEKVIKQVDASQAPSTGLKNYLTSNGLSTNNSNVGYRNYIMEGSDKYNSFRWYDNYKIGDYLRLTFNNLDIKTIFLIEKMGVYHGFYHVLNGLISSFDGVSPEKLNLHKLIERIDKNKYKEIIIAVKPCIEGEMTALYINNILSGRDLNVTRLASGIPMGADMDYVDALTLERAFDNRKNIS